MHDFTDARGKKWQLNLTLAAAERIDQADLSLLTQVDTSFLEPNEEMFNLLVRDTAVIFACIWCIILPEAEKEELSQEDFKDRISPSTLLPAKQAFWGELKDFFPDMEIVLSKMISGRARIMKKFAESVEKVEEDIDKAMDRKLEQSMTDLKKEIAK